ncbi:MAG: hypothetical protein DME25_14845, partial [Verrucomicrobia bacterium]
KALKTLSEPERKQLETTLRAYSSLSLAQRAQCVRSFKKFAGLSPDERRQFLKNAERWEQMSPAERQSWRDLVYQMPLLPPEIDWPPLPHVPAPRPSSRLIATNGN